MRISYLASSVSECASGLSFFATHTVLSVFSLCCFCFVDHSTKIACLYRKASADFDPCGIRRFLLCFQEMSWWRFPVSKINSIVILFTDIMIKEMCQIQFEDSPDNNHLLLQTENESVLLFESNPFIRSFSFLFGRIYRSYNCDIKQIWEFGKFYELAFSVNFCLRRSYSCTWTLRISWGIQWKSDCCSLVLVCDKTE